MRRTVSRVIRHEDGLLVLARGAGNRTYDARPEEKVRALGRVPKRDYVVTYRLSPRGCLLVERWMHSPLPGIFDVPVCFLPVEWIGRRVRRTVASRRRS